MIRFKNVDARRRRLMSRIRGRDTTPEIIVRRALHADGFRFRLHRNDLPGRPDIVLARHRVAIFVHGCFWHQHRCRKSMPKTRLDYWRPKLAANVKRDAQAAKALAELGWTVLVVWECETRDPQGLAAKLAKRLADSVLTQSRKGRQRVGRTRCQSARRRATA